jgi:arylsulfatase A-like enzyme
VALSGRPSFVAVAAALLGLSCDDSRQDGEPTETAAKPVAAARQPKPRPPRPPPPPKAPPRPLNVLMLTVDAMRSDMPWQGYSRPIAPVMTKLAEQSVVYTNAYAVSSYTAKSVAALLSGQYPSSLYRSGVFFTRYPGCNDFMAEGLQRQGVRTLAWHSHMYFGRGKGFDQGFDVWEMVPGITFDPQTDNHVTSPKTTKLAMELLGKPENTSGQFLAWTHYTDPHDVYVKHKECPDWGKTNRDRYDSEICFTDMWLGRLLEWAEKQSWWKDTALIITSDHGEAFGEHGMYRHAFDVWEPLVRVPLMIKAPGIKPKRIDLRRSQIDLPPTIMELMGKKPLESFVGKSLVPELYGAEEPDNREPIVVELPEDSNNPFRRAIIEGKHKIIALNKWHYRLYDLDADPGEENDLAKSEPETFERMKKRFDEVFAKIPYVQPFGGNKLTSGKTARGLVCPPKTDHK